MSLNRIRTWVRKRMRFIGFPKTSASVSTPLFGLQQWAGIVKDLLLAGSQEFGGEFGMGTQVNLTKRLTRQGCPVYSWSDSRRVLIHLRLLKRKKGPSQSIIFSSSVTVVMKQTSFLPVFFSIPTDFQVEVTMWAGGSQYLLEWFPSVYWNPVNIWLS